ncbi:MAG TPA: efflux RND transporter periplasmic adaptor subunit [Stellaceae bacterium]|nr:efflux RND transporter periplasmic adaptor subunit [Stellaceae bacterium]
MTRRRAITFAVLAALAGGAVLLWLQLAHEALQTRLVLLGDIDVRQVDLSFKVPGRVATLAVDEGDHVKAGEVLATLDKAYFEDDLRTARAAVDAEKAALEKLQNGSRPEEIAQARANLAMVKATLVNARQTEARQHQLANQGAATRQAADDAIAAERQAAAQVDAAEQTLRLAEIGPRQEDIAAAKAGLEQAEAALIVAQRRMTDSDLVAPSDGIVLTRAREAGSIVGTGDTVFTETLSTPVWVHAYVGERDLGHVHPGMTADVTSDSTPGKHYRARVGFVSSLAEFTPKTVETTELRTDLVYRVRLLIDRPDDDLRQGMPVTASLDLGGSP